MSWYSEVTEEHKELGERIAKLTKFIALGCLGLTDKHKLCLRRQRHAMLEYYDVLTDRLTLNE